MSTPDLERKIATLWQLALNENHVSCSVYRNGRRFLLRVESPSATIVTEPFDLQPRAMARAHALRESLKRRGWLEASAVSGDGDA